MKKPVFYTELAYVLGIVALALGTALMEKSDFGVSMVVAPAYLLFLKASAFWPALTFGTVEYLFQAGLLLIMMLVLKKARLYYLFSFVTAVLYGAALDMCMSLVALMKGASLPWRMGYYLSGVLICALGVSLIFHTYFAPEVYELAVKEISAKYRLPIHRVKTVYDCISCFTGIVLSFCFFGFGQFYGVRLGTIVCALINGFLIGRISAGLDHVWTFSDGLPLRKYFS